MVRRMDGEKGRFMLSCSGLQVKATQSPGMGPPV